MNKFDMTDLVDGDDVLLTQVLDNAKVIRGDLHKTYATIRTTKQDFYRTYSLRGRIGIYILVLLGVVTLHFEKADG